MNAASWTIEDLTAQVAVALSVDYQGPGDGRAREVPDLRTIRYYTTLGLIDRPAAMRGRTALYGHRHLLQIVALKRLQAKGHSLAELQHRLIGMTDAELAEVAKLPADGIPGATPEVLPNRHRGAFWTERPGPLPPPLPIMEPAGDLPLQGIRLADEITLLFAPARALDQADLEAIRTAAGPLLKLLEQRRLRPKRERSPA
jgi:DNA-binding transcriptional MerR regulator